MTDQENGKTEDERESALENLLKSDSPKVLAVGMGKKSSFIDKNGDNLKGHDVLFYERNPSEHLEKDPKFLERIFKRFVDEKTSFKSIRFDKQFQDKDGNITEFERLSKRAHEEINNLHNILKDGQARIDEAQHNQRRSDHRPHKDLYMLMHVLEPNNDISSMRISKSLIPRVQMTGELLTESARYVATEAGIGEEETDFANLKTIIKNLFSARNEILPGDPLEKSEQTARDIANTARTWIIKKTQREEDAREKTKLYLDIMANHVPWFTLDAEETDSIQETVAITLQQGIPSHLVETVKRAAKDYHLTGKHFFSTLLPNIRSLWLEENLLLFVKEANNTINDFNEINEVVQQALHESSYLSDGFAKQYIEILLDSMTTDQTFLDRYADPQNDSQNARERRARTAELAQSQPFKDTLPYLKDALTEYVRQAAEEKIHESDTKRPSAARTRILEAIEIGKLISDAGSELTKEEERSRRFYQTLLDILGDKEADGQENHTKQNAVKEKDAKEKLIQAVTLAKDLSRKTQEDIDILLPIARHVASDFNDPEKDTKKSENFYKECSRIIEKQTDEFEGEAGARYAADVNTIKTFLSDIAQTEMQSSEYKEITDDLKKIDRMLMSALPSKRRMIVDTVNRKLETFDENADRCLGQMPAQTADSNLRASEYVNEVRHRLLFLLTGEATRCAVLEAETEEREAEYEKNATRYEAILKGFLPSAKSKYAAHIKSMAAQGFEKAATEPLRLIEQRFKDAAEGSTNEPDAHQIDIMMNMTEHAFAQHLRAGEDPALSRMRTISDIILGTDIKLRHEVEKLIRKSLRKECEQGEEKLAEASSALNRVSYTHHPFFLKLANNTLGADIKAFRENMTGVLNNTYGPKDAPPLNSDPATIDRTISRLEERCSSAQGGWLNAYSFIKADIEKLLAANKPAGNQDEGKEEVRAKDRQNADDTKHKDHAIDDEITQKTEVTAGQQGAAHNASKQGREYEAPKPTHEEPIPEGKQMENSKDEKSNDRRYVKNPERLAMAIILGVLGAAGATYLLSKATTSRQMSPIYVRTHEAAAVADDEENDYADEARSAGVPDEHENYDATATESVSTDLQHKLKILEGKVKEEYSAAIESRLMRMASLGYSLYLMTDDQKRYLLEDSVTSFMKMGKKDEEVLESIDSAVTRYVLLNKERKDLLSALKGTAHSEFDIKANPWVENLQHAVMTLDAEAIEYLCNKKQLKNLPISEDDIMQNLAPEGYEWKDCLTQRADERHKASRYSRRHQTAEKTHDQVTETGASKAGGKHHERRIAGEAYSGSHEKKHAKRYEEKLPADVEKLPEVFKEFYREGKLSDIVVIDDGPFFSFSVTIDSE